MSRFLSLDHTTGSVAFLYLSTQRFYVSNMASMTLTTLTTPLIPLLFHTSPQNGISKDRSTTRSRADTQTYKIESPLLRLPLEIRLQIYRHALTLSSPETPKISTHTSNPIFLGTIATALLLTNRQVYLETRLLPFQVNNFNFIKWYGSSIYNARRFLQRLDTWQRAALKSMEIHVVGREIVEGWRREEGWDVVKRLLGGAKLCRVTVVVNSE